MRSTASLLPLLLALSPAAGLAQPPPQADAPPGHRPGVLHDFHDAERWSRVFDDPERDAWQKPQEVVALLAIEPGMTVVDLGAGTGYFEPYLSHAVGAAGKVLALDAEQGMVDHLTTRAERQGLANVEARRVPYDDPELAPASVDRVLIVDTWHHIADRPAYAAKLRRALAPGGAVYIVDFTLETAKGPPKAHRLAPETVAAELAAGGLEAQVLEETLPDQYVVGGRLPAEARR